MRTKTLIIGLAAALALSGCVDLSTPESTLGSAFKAVNDGKVKRLKKTLEGSALEQFGHEEGLAELKILLDQHHVTIGEKTRASSVHDDFGRLVSTTDTVDVLGTEKGMIDIDPPVVLNATVNCSIEYQYVPCAPDWLADSWCYADVLWDGQWCYNPNDISLGSRHRVFCRNGYEPVVNTDTTCKISDLRI